MPCMKKLKIEPLNVEGFTIIQNRIAVGRLQTELYAWEGTMYRGGYCEKSIAVDCVHFVASVLDKLCGTWYNHSKLPQDTSFHNKKEANEGFRQFIKMYPSYRLRSDVVQPGDVIVCGPVGINGGPGHTMIVGKDALWHVGHKEVCKAGLAVMQKGAYAFKQVRRLKDRSKMRGYSFLRDKNNG